MDPQARKIQLWWKFRTSMRPLKQVRDEVYKLSKEKRQEYVDKNRAIKKVFSGDGCGLNSGTVSEKFTSAFFQQNINCVPCNKGECDQKICDNDISMKKIHGMSSLALDWSKNIKVSTRENFTCPIMIVNLKGAKWWKISPRPPINQLTPVKKDGYKITYTDWIPAGIYFVDKQFCKRYVKLTKNNKSNKFIEPIFVYLMLKRSISLKMFIPLPPAKKVIKFNILNAFSE